MTASRAASGPRSSSRPAVRRGVGFSGQVEPAACLVSSSASSVVSAAVSRPSRRSAGQLGVAQPVDGRQQLEQPARLEASWHQPHDRAARDRASAARPAVTVPALATGERPPSSRGRHRRDGRLIGPPQNVDVDGDHARRPGGSTATTSSTETGWPNSRASKAKRRQAARPGPRRAPRSCSIVGDLDRRAQPEVAAVVRLDRQRQQRVAELDAERAEQRTWRVVPPADRRRRPARRR